MNNKTEVKKYDRVMSRVYNRPRCGTKPQVIRHEKPTGSAKPSVSNVSSSIFSELPVILNDYTPELECKSPEKEKRRTFVVKPRKTIPSMDPALSPHRSVKKPEEVNMKPCTTKPRASTASLQLPQAQRWSENHYRQCLSSRSHTKVKELRDEIKAYGDTEKFMRLRCNLFKKCGIVFDDVGHVANDKAVQVEVLEPDKRPEEIRSQQHHIREDAGTSLPNQQVRLTPRYPVDRYMVESSKDMEMVNIIENDLWHSEPTMRPEDEILLRKLHDMLQSTSDDLKLLSGELAKFHEPGVQIKTTPTPLDEEFNEKVHIEELVNAKFHGYKIIDKTSNVSNTKVRKEAERESTPQIEKPVNSYVTNSVVQINSAPKRNKSTKNLRISRTKIVQIDGKNDCSVPTERLNNGKIIRNVPTVTYNEFSYKYIEPEVQVNLKKKFQIQVMPSINIRSELKEQKVLNIDILPEPNKKKNEINASKSNVVVLTVNHEPPITLSETTKDDGIENTQSNYLKPVRKVSKMSTEESSESTNVIRDHRNINGNKLTVTVGDSPKTSARIIRSKSPILQIKEPEIKKSHNLEEWRRKLNAVYGYSTSKNTKTKVKLKSVGKKSSPKKVSSSARIGMFNNAEYIPYSQLTVGGIRVTDLEKNMSNISNRNNEPFSNVFDKIISSKEHTPRYLKPEDSPKILTTSDENLLQEIIDIERTISDTISNNIGKKEIGEAKQEVACDEDNLNESYADDFEDDKSMNTEQSENEIHKTSAEQSNNSYKFDRNDLSVEHLVVQPTTSRNKSSIKTSNLSIKDSVEVFEFVHSVDTQDIAIQSSTDKNIQPNETQTSPRNDIANIHPIYNDLWPSFDPKGEIEKMLKLEKEFIKKLIIDEYGDLLEKNITKPSTSHDSQNIAASQKNTQTSPARVKSIMTSPKRTKTRTTSPFVQLTVTADQQTSPISLLPIGDHQDNRENHDITINLSSPRFSLQLPKNSREVLSNLDAFSQSSKMSSKIIKKINSESSSSFDAGSSSELSSLGEVRFSVNRRFRRNRIPTISDSSSSSNLSKYSFNSLTGGIIPLRSEGEIMRVKTTKSDGEASFGVSLS